MARFKPLVWAVPLTLALLVLAKGALRTGQPAATSGRRVAPAVVQRLEPPGRLHAINHARSVQAAAQPSVLPVQPAAGNGPQPLFPATAPASGTGPEEKRVSQSTHAQPAHTQPPPIVYPIVESDDRPQMADAFPGIESIAASRQRLPADASFHTASRTTFATAPSATSVASETLSAARQQVAQMNQKAVKLAQRGALYSARAELLEALRLIAQAQDAASGTTQRTVSLAAALTAMDESDDFTRPAAAAGAALAVTDIIRAHQTPVLKRIDVSRLSPLTCSQHYYAYAEQQLSQATGGQPMAAGTLSLLGMVHGHLAGQSTGGRSSHTARAIVFHQATLAIDPRHYQSANELGVLWARCGELAAARKVLLTSLQSHPTASAWHNLAAVHDRMGERDLAQLARKEEKLLSPKTPRAAAGPAVEWVDAATFAAQSRAGGAQAVPGKTAEVSAASHATAPQPTLRR